MSSNDPVKELQQLVQSRVATAAVSIDSPADPAKGSTWLDVNVGTRGFVVEWRAAWGFGVSRRTGAEGLGEPPEEWLQSADEAARWIESRAKTIFGQRLSAPSPIWSQSDASAAE